MKIEEFKEEIDSIGFYNDKDLRVEESQFEYVIKDGSIFLATVSKLTTYLIDENYVGFMELTEGLRRDLLDAMYKFASTPLDEREDEKKYYLKHRFLENGNCRYLNYDKEFQELYLNDRAQFGEIQTQFTQKEIDEIKERYDTTLDDFEQIEVAEWQ